MGGIQKKIYDRVPYPIKFLILNLKAYQNYKQRYTKNFDIYLDEHIKLWDADIEIIKDYQKQKLIELLSEVYLYSDWYSNIMKGLDISINDIKNTPYKVLKKMPVLTKSDRKNNTDLLVNINRKTIGIGYSSGTSGSPTKNYLDLTSINRSFALWKRFHKTIGLQKIVKQVRFSGRIVVDSKKKSPPFWVYNCFEKQLLMSSYHLKDENLIHYVNKLNRFKPILLDGFPSTIYILSRYINQNNLKLSFTPKAIAVTAETLYDYQRTEIEEAFNCHVFNQYASSEGSPFITECIEGNLHLNIDSGFFEFINTKGELAKPGELAQLVVTSFTNFKTPLIRYNIEDTVLLHENNTKCACGCLMPIIEKITGREDDILWTEEKGYVGRMGPAFKGFESIIKSQIIQNSPTDIVINIIVDDLFNKSMEAQFLHNLKDRLGSSISYQINKVDNIPLGPNGKYSTVKRNFEVKN